MFWSGKALPGFRAVSLGSFHLLILPKNISASTGPVTRNSPGLKPSRLITGTVPPNRQGSASILPVRRAQQAQAGPVRHVARGAQSHGHHQQPAQGNEALALRDGERSEGDGRAGSPGNFAGPQRSVSSGF